MKVSVAEVEPFGGVDSGIEGEKEGVVKLRVLDFGKEQDERE